jgi:hypothetical protein
MFANMLGNMLELLEANMLGNISRGCWINMLADMLGNMLGCCRATGCAIGRARVGCGGGSQSRLQGALGRG